MILADVSNNNGNVDVTKLGSAVILKATEGRSFKDGTALVRRADAIRHGMAVGFYHFAHPGDSVAAQLVNYLDVVHDLGGSLYLPPILDLEVTDGESWPTVQGWARSWGAGIDRYHRAGKIAHPGRILYSSPAFIRGQLGDPQDDLGYLLWIAHWGVKKPDVPRGWKTWALWQFTDAGRLGGYSPLDLSIFAGTAHQLAALGTVAKPKLNPRTWHWLRYTFIPQHYAPANWGPVWTKLTSDPAAAARLAKKFGAPA